MGNEKSCSFLGELTTRELAVVNRKIQAVKMASGGNKRKFDEKESGKWMIFKVCEL